MSIVMKDDFKTSKEMNLWLERRWPAVIIVTIETISLNPPLFRLWWRPA